MIAILEPTYGVYRVSAALNDIGIAPIELDGQFQIDLATTLASIPAGAKMVFCCSPNNPTGNLLRREDVLKLCSEIKGLVIVDEAYVEFSNYPNGMAKNVLQTENLVVLRTLSKGDFVEQSAKLIRQQREMMISQLASFPQVLKAYPSDANFILVRFRDARSVFDALYKRGIVVRRRSEPRLTNCLRITVGTPEENVSVLETIEEVCA